ncbi:MAG: hypothetical protein H0X28_11085 [Solirubrobacterales bacterium]|nr:hypothetical protein [Solirubrobacterales bacterium]
MRLAPVPPPWSELARADCTVPGTPDEVALLARVILYRKRDYPIVVLTARRGEARPALAPVEVREIIGPGIPVYFVTNNLATYLAECPPAQTQVWGGAARVYWPGVTSDPWGHPLLYDYNGLYGPEILDRLAKIFTPSVAREVELNPEQRILVLERDLARVRRQRARELGVLRGRSRYDGMLPSLQRPCQRQRSSKVLGYSMPSLRSTAASARCSRL